MQFGRDPQVMISLEANDSVSSVSRIQKITPRSIANCDVVDLIGCTLPIKWNPCNLMAVFLFIQCATNDEAVETLESHTIIRDFPSYVGARSYLCPLDIQINHPDRNVSFRNPILDCIKLLIERFLLHWKCSCIVLYYWDISFSGSSSQGNYCLSQAPTSPFNSISY